MMSETSFDKKLKMVPIPDSEPTTDVPSISISAMPVTSSASNAAKKPIVTDNMSTMSNRRANRLNKISDKDSSKDLKDTKTATPKDSSKDASKDKKTSTKRESLFGFRRF